MAKAPATTLHLLTQQESAEYLRCTDRTIRNYIASGLLPAYRIRGSRSIRIRVEDLDELLRPIPSAKVG